MPYHFLWYLLLCIYINNIYSYTTDTTTGTTGTITKKQYHIDVVHAIKHGKHDLSIALLREANEIYPNHVDFLQLLGSLLWSSSEGLEFLTKAMILDNYQTPDIIANYIETLRATGGENIEKARRIGEESLVKHPTNGALIYNLAAIYDTININIGGTSTSNTNSNTNTRLIQLYTQCTEVAPLYINCWKKLINMQIEGGYTDDADRNADLALSNPVFTDPTMRAEVMFLKGLNAHRQNKLKEALVLYLEVTTLIPIEVRPMVWANLAALYHVLGDTTAAVAMYDVVLPHFPDDAMIMNNYGALLGIMGRKEEELLWLTRAHAIDPHMMETCINLGSVYQDAGDIPKALELFDQAKRLDSASATVLTLRQNLMPVG